MNNDGKQHLGLIVVLNRDLFFGVKIGNVLRGLGYEVAFAAETETFVERVNESSPAPVLGIIDMSAGVNWELIGRLNTGEKSIVPNLVFGSHLDVEGRRAAKAAGVTRVLSNGDFHRDMVSLVKRYAKAEPRPG